MQKAWLGGVLDRVHLDRVHLDRVNLARAADVLVVAVAASLPWSTSATTVLIVLWLLALLPTLQRAPLLEVVRTPAGGLPVGLCALALVGMLWSGTSMAERWDGFQAFLRLLAIPLLFMQFNRSAHCGWRVAGGFLAACSALLLVSWAIFIWPWLRPSAITAGVPVKDYVVQSGEFLLCAFGLTHWGITAWQQNQRRLAVALAVLTLGFLTNLTYVATSRASMVVYPILLAVLARQRFAWRGALVAMTIGVLLGAAAWTSSSYLNQRVAAVPGEVARQETAGELTSTGSRLVWWRKSLDFIAAAPVLGHGTGSIRYQFRQAAGDDPNPQPNNPHNQTLSIAIQLGLLGVSLLYGMWIAHVLLLRGAGLPFWLGMGVVVQHIVESLFNSQLFYFNPGWIYVFGVGVLGGMVFRRTPNGLAHP
jgi:O-antigen ligase